MKLNQDEEFKLEAVLQRRDVFQKKGMSTTRGKQSDELSQHAIRLYETTGQDVLAYFEKAIHIAEEDKNPIAIVRAKFQCANYLLDRKYEAHISNLTMAHRFITDIVDHPVSREDIIFFAKSLDLKGHILKRMIESNSKLHTEELAQQIIECSLRACETIPQWHFAFWDTAIMIYFNCANRLFNQQQYRYALLFYNKALNLEKLARRKELHDFTESKGSLEFSRRLLMLRKVKALLQTTKVSDRNEGHKILNGTTTKINSLSNEESFEFADCCRLMSSEDSSWFKYGKKAFERVNNTRSTVINDSIYVELLRIYKPEDFELFCDEKIQYWFNERRRCIDDLSALQINAQIQKWSDQKVSHYLDNERHLDAFLALEFSSSKAYADTIDRHTYQASTETKHLAQKESELQQFYSLLKILMLIPPEVLGDHLINLEVKFDEPEYVERLQTVCQSESPRESIDELIRSIRGEIKTIQCKWERVDPSLNFRPHYQPCNQDILRAICEEHPKSIFIRSKVFMENENSAALHFISVDWHQEKIRVQASSIQVNPELWSLLSVIKSNPTDFQSQREIDTLLQSIQIASVLEVQNKDVCVLPCFWSALVPWIGTGDLINHINSLSILPNLQPLRTRQAPLATVQKNGSIFVAPGKHAEKITSCHTLPLEVPLESETCLLDLNANIDAVLKEMEAAECIALYAHGINDDDADQVQGVLLTNGTITPDMIQHRMLNTERLELWACESGVNIPTNPMEPYMDEAFGLDIDFHKLGVRSTIGTLWSVLDIVTGQISKKYREYLKTHPSPKALLLAQRWWKNEKIPEIQRKIAQHEPLDTDYLPVDSSHLGPISEDDIQKERFKQAELLCVTTAWSGYRFVGVANRKQYTHEEYEKRRNDINKTISKAQKSSPVMDSETELLQARQQPLTSEHAIRVSHLYTIRRKSDYKDNLHRGLSWLHEALTLEQNNTIRENLQEEIAIMWFLLARGENPVPGYPFAHQVKMWKLRCQRSLHELSPKNTVRVIIQQCLDWLKAHEQSVTPLDVQVWISLWEQTYTFQSHVNKLRIQVILLDLISVYLSDNTTIERIHSLLESWKLTDFPTENVQKYWFVNGVAEIAYLQTRMGISKDRLICSDDIFRFLRPSSTIHYVFALRTQINAFNSAINNLESRYWGYADIPFEYVTTTGTPSDGWHTLFELIGSDILTNTDFSINLLSNLHLSTDVRSNLLIEYKKLRGIMNQFTKRENIFDGNLVKIHSLLSTCMQDISCAPSLLEDDLHEIDPYEQSASECLQFNPEHHNWIVGNAAEISTNIVPYEHQHNTLMMRIEYQLNKLEEALIDVQTLLTNFIDPPHEVVKEVRRRAPQENNPRKLIKQAFAPIDISLNPAHIAAMLKEKITANDLILLPYIVHGHVCIAILYKSDGQIKSKRVNSKDSIQQNLLHLWHSIIMEKNSGAWGELQEYIIPLLEEVLPEDVNSKQIIVFGQGLLSHFPWGSILVEQPILRQVRNLSEFLSEPTLFAHKHHTLCTMGLMPDAAPFGSKVIQTLRTAFPNNTPCESETKPQNTNIVETDAWKKNEGSAFRYYGSSSGQMCSSNEGLMFTYNRASRPRNLSFIEFNDMDVVQLWGVSSGLSELYSLINNTHQFPPIVKQFFDTGAHSIIDFAWNISDLTTALLCEFYNVLRHSCNHRPSMLMRFMKREVYGLLNQCLEQSPQEQCDTINKRRRQWYTHYSISTEYFQPFTYEDFSEVTINPMEVFTVRYWGRA